MALAVEKKSIRSLSFFFFVLAGGNHSTGTLDIALYSMGGDVCRFCLARRDMDEIHHGRRSIPGSTTGYILGVMGVLFVLVVLLQQTSSRRLFLVLYRSPSCGELFPFCFCTVFETFLYYSVCVCFTLRWECKN